MNAHSLPDEETAALRQDLSAAFRICHQMGWSESVGNHFSAAVSEDGAAFLLNPCWQHFATIRPEDLLRIDARDGRVLEGPGTPDASAWCVHGTLHRKKPEARVVLHAHSPYATALAILADSTLPPVDQNAATFYNRMVIDENYGGLAFEEEGERCAQLFDDPKKKVMVMG